MLNCKPGDLAIIIGSRQNPENIGRIVRVIEDWADRRFHKGHEWNPVRTEQHTWLIEFFGSPGVCRSPPPSSIVAMRQEGPILDMYLRPLPDEQDVLAYDKEVEIEVVK